MNQAFADTVYWAARINSFLGALALYEARPDKDYSLMDCASMATMRARGITVVLTRDARFAQDKFTRLP